MITLEQASEIFEYTPETGEITYKKDVSIRHKSKGRIATFKHDAGNGYVRMKVQVNKVHYQAHRIAWLLFHGAHPCGIIDHINGNPLDNRICNLRVVTSRENQLNRVRGTSIYKNNKYGIPGLYYVKVRGKLKWRAKFFELGESTSLGYFYSMFDACCAIMSKRNGG